jgi:hypothetical protein
MPHATIPSPREGGRAAIKLTPHDARGPHDPAGKHNRLQTTRELSQAENSKAEVDRRLDQALEQTFPASDPISVMICL